MLAPSEWEPWPDDPCVHVGESGPVSYLTDEPMGALPTSGRAGF